MKKIIKLLILTSIIIVGLISCEDETKNPLYNLDAESIETGAYFRAINYGGTINLLNLEDSSYSIQGELVTPENGADTENIELWVEFKDRSTETSDDSVSSTFINSVDVSTLALNSNGFPKHTFSMSIPEVLEALNLDSSLISGGDQILFQIIIKMKNGRVFEADNTGDSIRGELFFLSNFEYTGGVVCINPPMPGKWILEMTDLYGDGWNGGNIVVSIDGELTTYAAEGTGGTVTINIPEGTIEFTFTYSAGAWEGENLYTLTNPQGQIILDEGVGDESNENGPTEGELLNICP